jgi:hypothetical protein
MGNGGYTYMRYQRAYTRRQRAVTFAGATRTVTIPLEIPDFERLERLATEYNVGNATLCRQIIRQYLKRKAEKGLTLEPNLSRTGRAGHRSKNPAAANSSTMQCVRLRGSY